MERQELYCHNCNRYVQFNVPAENGRMVVVCPNCKHEHYRIVRNGVIAEDRWGSSQAPVMYSTNNVTSSASFIATYSTSSATTSSSSGFVLQSWLNTATGS